MDVQRQIEYWLEGSQEDIEAAVILFEKHKVRQSLFFAHLSLEKVLKAHVTQATAAIPPRTHDLLRLAALAGLSLSEQQREFLARLQQYCLEGRYPDLPLALPDGEEAAAQLDEAREIKSWLASQLT